MALSPATALHGLRSCQRNTIWVYPQQLHPRHRLVRQWVSDSECTPAARSPEIGSCGSAPPKTAFARTSGLFAEIAPEIVPCRKARCVRWGELLTLGWRRAERTSPQEAAEQAGRPPLSLPFGRPASFLPDSCFFRCPFDPLGYPNRTLTRLCFHRPVWCQCPSCLAVFSVLLKINAPS